MWIKLGYKSLQMSDEIKVMDYISENVMWLEIGKIMLLEICRDVSN